MLRDDLNIPINPIVNLLPFAGESLIGFLSRSIASTAISDFRSVSRLCGENLRIDRLNCEVPGSGLASLLGSSREELAKLIEQRFLHPPRELAGPIELKVFCRQNSLATRKIRRVAPAALRAANFHRRTWDMPVLEFDLETLTHFVDQCPICGEALGWRRAVEAIHCDHCTSDDGWPTVDLSAIQSLPIAAESTPGLRFASDLAHPWDAEARKRSERDTPVEWNTIAPDTLLEVLIAVARFGHSGWNPTKSVDAEAVSRAGAVLLGGQRALSAVLSEYPMAHHKLALGQHAVWMLETASRRMGITKVTHQRASQARSVLSTAARRADIAFRLAKDGTLVGGQKTQPRTREALPTNLWDAQDIGRVSDILGVTTKDISKLVRWGIIDLCAQSVLSRLPHRQFVSSASVRRLMESIRLRALSVDSCTLHWMKFISVKELKDNDPELGWAEIIAGLQTGAVPTFELHSAQPCWSSSLHVFAANSLRSVALSRARALWLERRAHQLDARGGHWRQLANCHGWGHENGGGSSACDG